MRNKHFSLPKNHRAAQFGLSKKHVIAVTLMPFTNTMSQQHNTPSEATHSSSFFKTTLILAFCSIAAACGNPPASSTEPQKNQTEKPAQQQKKSKQQQTEHLSAGKTTVFEKGKSAFSNPSANIANADDLLSFNLGDDFFERPWVSKKASTQSRDGLGPLFNNNACQNCHINDGRGHAASVNPNNPKDNGTDFSTLLIRANQPANAAQQKQMLAGKLANVPDKHFGGQLQNRANFGINHEVGLRVSYQPKTVTYADGNQVVLRKPIWHITENPKQGKKLGKNTLFSARVAQQMVGLGLLEAIEEKDILQQANIQNSNNQGIYAGITGKANYVWDIEKKSVQLGRFGWKAGQPTLKQQSAMAFLHDMGLTSKLLPLENCQLHQKDCLSSPNGNGDQNDNYAYEVSDKVLKNIAFYTQNLAVPVRRNAYTAKVQAGKKTFLTIGCATCHTPQYITSKNSKQKQLANQVIYPYTDMLLHDMGAELADFTINNQPVPNTVLTEFRANAAEWRTPPLWGIGLSKKVNEKASFLHDGRARNLEEAILWHAGEASAAQKKFTQLSQKEREALLAFLNSL